MIAGTLEIQMMANMARLADDMAQSKKIVGSTMKDIEGAVASAKAALGALGVGLGIGYFVSLIKGSIDAMDHLENLKKSTNLTIEELAGLSVLAKQSGSDLDGLAKGINMMTVQMGKSPDKFRELGISAKDPLKAFQQLADIFNLLPDIQQRNALAQAVFKKSWAEMAPTLSLGSERIGEAIDKGSKLSGVTEEMAQQAKAFNDKWIELVGTGGLLTRMVGPMLPLLNLLADGMLNVKEKTDGAKESFSPLLEALKVIVVMGANVSFMFETMGKDIARMFENVQLIAKGDFAGSRALGEMFRKDAESAKLALDAYTKTIMGAGLTGKAAPGAPGPDPAAAAAAAARAKAFLGGDETKAAEAKEQAIRDILHKVREHEDKLELDQIALQNKAREEAENLRLQILFDAIDREEAAAIAHGEELIRIEQWVADNKKKIQAGFMDFLGNVAGLMNTHSKKVFEIGKIGAIAQAGFKGALAVMDAWEAGMSTGGPWAPVIAAGYAAAAAANALNLINNIRTQQFGGSAGGVPVPAGQGGSGVLGGSGSAPPSFANTSQSQGSAVIFNVSVTGVVTPSVIEQMVEGLKDVIDNHDVTIIGPNSRQAALIQESA